MDTPPFLFSSDSLAIVLSNIANVFAQNGGDVMPGSYRICEIKSGSIRIDDEAIQIMNRLARFTNNGLMQKFIHFFL